jgi:hypothetical protein
MHCQRSGASLWSGSSAAASIDIAFWTQVSRDLANVSVSDDFRFVIWLFAFLGLGGGFWFTFHATSPCSSGLGD